MLEHQELLREPAPRPRRQRCDRGLGADGAATSSSARRTATASSSTASSTTRAWRLEWGPPQRPYIAGHELRMRMELGLPPDLQMLLITKSLMRGAREARPSSSSRRATRREIGRRDARGDALAGDVPEDRRQRLEDPAHPLRRRLEPADTKARPGSTARSRTRSSAPPATLAAREPPFVLMTLRGRIYLRMQLAERRRDRRRRRARAVRDRRRPRRCASARARGEEPVRWSHDDVDAPGSRSARSREER